MKFPFLLLLVLPIIWSPTQAQVLIGEPLPMASTALSTTGGGTASLESVAGTSGLLVLFWSERCAWAARYLGRVEELAESNPGFGVVLVNSDSLSADEPEAPPASIPRATYLRDASGSIAEALGALAVPEAFLFDASMLLSYRGAIDDSPSSADRVSRAYVQLAMDDLSNGSVVRTAETRAFGCAVRASRR